MGRIEQYRAVVAVIAAIRSPVASAKYRPGRTPAMTFETLRAVQQVRNISRWRSHSPESLRDAVDDKPRPTVESGSDLYLCTESRLEILFVQYSNSRISKDAFREEILKELKVIRQKINDIRKMRAAGTISEVDSKLRLNQGRDALAAARWCLEWADGLHMDEQSSLLRPPGRDDNP